MMRKFSIFTVIFTFIALILGNLVVATDSGDACGTHWPLCNGSVIPDFTDYHVIIEYSHRMFTTMLGLVILVNAIGALIKYRDSKAVRWLTYLSFGLLLFQSMIGGLNVLLGTPPGFTTFDVTFSQLLLLTMVLLSYSLHRRETPLEPNQRKSVTMSYRAFTIGFIGYIFQIILGAFFKHSAASSVVLRLPAQEYLIESPQLANVIYSLHWVATVVVAVGAIWFLIYSSKLQYHLQLAWLYLISIILNAVVGVAIVVTKNVVVMSSLHMAVSTTTMVIGGSILGGYWFKLKKA
ncbi:COX15/CtaA family protein [Thalassobacillus pellis]|uniref:COX15/CtaA family protein n=1 Tax=Thalassobacillus pellis TaxID=748008 RepID=UPI001EF787F6|nr:COX15/CtaA family protein [Thalassobacillus pellis]MBM7551401.1 cytochrome c oxidase assembly protein subunit 15 [Thalassobacillus pellis]